MGSPQLLNDSHVSVDPVQAIRTGHRLDARNAANDELGQVGLLVPRHQHEIVSEHGRVL